MDEVQLGTKPVASMGFQGAIDKPSTDRAEVDVWEKADAGAIAEGEANREANKYYEDWVIGGSIVDFGRGVARDFTSGGNIAVDVVKDLQRATEAGATDKGWVADRKFDFITKNRKDIPYSQEWRYYATRNEEEAKLLMGESKSNLAQQKISAQLTGLTGIAASIASGLVDLDTPLTLATGGLSLSARTGWKLSKAGQYLEAGVSGAAMGVALGAVDYAVNPTMDAEDIVMYGIMGGGLSLAGRAAFGPDLLHTKRTEAAEEVGDIVANGKPRDIDTHPANPDAWGFQKAADEDEIFTGKVAGKPKDEAAVVKDQGEVQDRMAEDGPDSVIKEGDIIGEGSTVGAMAPNTLPNHDWTKGLDAESKKIVFAANTRAKGARVLNEVDDPEWNTKNAITDFLGKTAYKFSQGIQAIGVGTDWGRAMKSNSIVERMLAYDLMESPAGIANNNVSAALLQESFRKEFAVQMQPFVDAMDEFKYKIRGNSRWDEFTDRGRQTITDFNEAVVAELMGRKHGGRLIADPNDPVKKAADAWDKLMELDIKIGQGRGGKSGIASYESMKAATGYVPQRWSGKNMHMMVEEARKTGGQKGADTQKRKLIQAVEEDYAKNHPTMKPDDRRIYAQAVVDRALITRKGMGRDLLGILTGDEAEFIKAALQRNNIPPQQVDRLIESLIGSRETKTQLGHTQERVDVDFRSTSSNGIRMMDLLETDLFSMGHQRMARTSGLAALASKGIRSRVDFEAIVKAAQAEKLAKGDLNQPRPGLKGVSDGLNEIDAKYWGDVYSYFNGTPAAGGVSPTWSMLKKVTSLALMNQLGLTSMGEFGAIAGGVGMKHFARHAGSQLADALKRKDSELVKELKHVGIYVPEESVFRPDMMFEIEKGQASSDLMRRADLFMNKATRAQGYLSGFFAVRQAQHKLAITSTLSKVFEGIKRADEQFSPERLRSMGFEPDRWEKYVNNGTVEYDANGNLVKLNADKWDYEDLELLRTSSARVSNQFIQRAMIGESNALFHKDGIAQLFWQFKSFPLLAMEKQFNRNLRMADSTALMTFVWGTVMAGAAYAAKQTINGNTQNLTWDKITRGGLNMGNLTGWMPMWVDPVASLLGMDDYNMSGYSSRGGAGSIISIPAGFSTLNNILSVPQAAVRIAGSPTGLTEYTNKDIRTIQSGTMIGQMYGMNWLLNTMKHEPKKRGKAVQETAQEPVPGNDVQNKALDVLGYNEVVQ